MVHTANMPSFLGRTVYFSPVDGKNLNRVYPAEPTARFPNASLTPSPKK
jgi:predicted deacylase